MFDDYPNLSSIISYLDEYLQKTHPLCFGSNPAHPFLGLKRSKILHDNLWGTNRFTWHELAIIDSPIFQRLRYIHQTGLAYQVYMSAHHTRFEHSLGVTIVASRIFEKIMDHQGNLVHSMVKAIWPDLQDGWPAISRLKQELRLAALLHDTGHSLFSHTSEYVYSKLRLLIDASNELTKLTGKKKGCGEVLSFCLASTSSIKDLINNARPRLLGDPASDEHVGEIDFRNVALMIVGRAIHPFLQFLGDIISSSFDVDKLDYLLRDATNAGLPLQYDLQRYLFSVRLEKDILADGQNQLMELYSNFQLASLERKKGYGRHGYPYYEAYRLKLPTKALNTIEQIVICKLMLFSYIYHHQKVRASEGLLQRLLERIVDGWRKKGFSDQEILGKFFDLTDPALYNGISESQDEISETIRYRLIYRLLPRETFSIAGSCASHADRLPLQDFMIQFMDEDKREIKIRDIELDIGKELIKLRDDLGDDPMDALLKAGVWFDVPNQPKFEDIDDIVLGGGTTVSIPLPEIFPIGEWTDAYKHYRYKMRIFCFSEYVDLVKRVAKNVLKAKIKIMDNDFYDKILKRRVED